MAWKPTDLSRDALGSQEKFSLAAVPPHVRCAGCGRGIQSRASRPLCCDCIIADELTVGDDRRRQRDGFPARRYEGFDYRRR